LVVDAAGKSEGVTVHTMNPVPGRGPVFYASLPRDADNPKGDVTSKEEAKHLLISILWDHLSARESPLRTCCQSSPGDPFPIQVVCGLLGQPRLILGAYRGPAISFSEGGGKVWAALCGDESDIGIDVAGIDDFQGEYPLRRVFHPQELQHALRLASGELENAAALLWSIKEAVVKALGCAFHLVDPRQITVYPSVGGGGYTFPVCLSGKALMRFPMVAGQSLLVRSLPHGKLWLSIALLNRRPTGHE
jgi:phosphopantetheine--protein transferase-like protein